MFFCSSSQFELVLYPELFWRARQSNEGNLENEGKEQDCLLGQEMGFQLSEESVISQCPFVGVSNGVFSLIVSEKNPYQIGMSAWSCLPSHSPHLPEASGSCWLAVTQWQQFGSHGNWCLERGEEPQGKAGAWIKCVMRRQGLTGTEPWAR